MNKSLTSSNGSRLRDWRTARHLSLSDVAGLTGLSESVLSRVERGMKGLRPMTKVLVARRVGARVADLFDPIDIPIEDDEDSSCVPTT